MTKIEEALAVMEGKSDSLHSDALKLLSDAKDINRDSTATEVSQITDGSKQ